jgi:hypothetical protein
MIKDNCPSRIVKKSWSSHCFPWLPYKKALQSYADKGKAAIIA